jgi:hypothetical protein
MLAIDDARLFMGILRDDESPPALKAYFPDR